ncbi:MAG: META domain-containing protein [Ectothiorhodospiraceae bacterium]|nr:META domain-containing protein [Ectothiorhodospiraceae bacterium]
MRLRIGLIVGVSLLWLGGCAAPGPTAMEEPETLRAVGNEPGWRADLDADTLAISADYGGVEFRLERPRGRPTADGGLRYAGDAGGHQVALVLHERRCRDTMTGMPYPYRARLHLDDRELPGCGGSPDSLISGPTWQIHALDGQATDTRHRPTIAFQDGNRVVGHSSCNHYSGAYALSGEGLRLGELVSTRMACPSPQMAQERLLFALLKSVYRFDLDDSDALVLYTADGRTLTARRDGPPASGGGGVPPY